MSLFQSGGFGGQAMPSQAMDVDAAKIETATTEIELMMGLFENVVQNCKAKCFVRYYVDSDLTKGETCCVDRCTAKFMKANMAVSKYLDSQGATPATFSSVSAILPTLGQHNISSQ